MNWHSIIYHHYATTRHSYDVEYFMMWKQQKSIVLKVCRFASSFFGCFPMQYNFCFYATHLNVAFQFMVLNYMNYSCGPSFIYMYVTFELPNKILLQLRKTYVCMSAQNFIVLLYIHGDTTYIICEEETLIFSFHE